MRSQTVNAMKNAATPCQNPRPASTATAASMRMVAASRTVSARARSGSMSIGLHGVDEPDHPQVEVDPPHGSVVDELRAQCQAQVVDHRRLDVPEADPERDHRAVAQPAIPRRARRSHRRIVLSRPVVRETSGSGRRMKVFAFVGDTCQCMGAHPRPHRRGPRVRPGLRDAHERRTSAMASQTFTAAPADERGLEHGAPLEPGSSTSTDDASTASRPTTTCRRSS